MLRVLHLTDPHLFADPDGALRGTVTYATLSNVITDYLDGDWRADIAVVTGDLIHDDSAQAYVHFRQLLDRLELPVYCLPGNHDIRELMRDTLNRPPYHYCAAIERDNWLIACIDSCVSGSAGGAVGEPEMQRLLGLIENAAAEHVMVCLHHPPVPMGSKWLDTVGLSDGADFLRRIAARGKVRLAIFGHVHQEYDVEHQGIRVIATPSTCRQFLPGSDEFAVDENPPAYRRISLGANGGFEAELVWVSPSDTSGS